MKRKDAGGPAGLVLEIQKMSTEDGPGLRTTVFLKGCSLSCRWCHNPESISSRPEVRWIENRCIGCRVCVNICPVSALRAAPEGIVIDRDICTGCGSCADECPSAALELWGRRMTSSRLFSELVKDKAYFGSEGGVTLSGGEAALQAPFVNALFRLLQAEGIHTALDTCGVCTPKQLETACTHADLVLFDLKEADEKLHRDFTGGPLELVKRNFAEVVRIIENSKLHRQAWKEQRVKKLWIRTPIIPGMTDRRENIEGIAAFLLSCGEELFDRWELCAFNKLCVDKYRRLGREWELKDAGLMTAERMDELVETARQAGIAADRVGWNGMVRDRKQ